ncbi:MAG: S-methyl-5-thioribose-1-phosphate isomerase [Candidatus Diapherotrites archaeon]|nr:S-methyl-5-thioribose-1-phosphate isomerase [Candidatus Diapherotrites archaeon]
MVFNKIVLETVRKIKSLEIQGSSNVRKAVIFAIKESVLQSKVTSLKRFRAELGRNIILLAEARPTEPETRNALVEIWKIAEQEIPVEKMKNEIVIACEAHEQNREKSMQKICKNAERELKKCETIFTHCHSSTVERILKTLHDKGHLKRVLCTETRPLFQGRITAAKLLEAGINCTMIVDSAARAFIGEADAFLTGCDAVFYNGSIVNKIGTSMISLAAKRKKVPHYVATVSQCFDPATYYGKKIEIEERGYNEVWPEKPVNLQIRNPAFDITEAELVKAIICEQGVFKPKNFGIFMAKKLKLKGKKYKTLEELIKPYL